MTVKDLIFLLSKYPDEAIVTVDEPMHDWPVPVNEVHVAGYLNEESGLPDVVIS